MKDGNEILPRHESQYGRMFPWFTANRVPFKHHTNSPMCVLS